jgi:ribonuclease J
MDIIPVGGFSEIGRNCVVIKAGDDAVMLDLGLLMENYVRYSEDEDVSDFSPKKLMEINAVPDIDAIKDVKPYIKAICISHAHLDHVGAVPFMASKFDCPVHAAPFTAEVIKIIARDEEIPLKNDIISHKVNSRFKVGKNMEVEFINMTHSVPHTVVIVVHTPEGCVAYANDFKFDNAPLLGQKPNYDRLRELKPKVLIMDSLYSTSFRKTASESIARELLRDVLLGTGFDGKQAVVVTTFSSHIARLKTLQELGEKMNRKVVFLGRSIGKYVAAAEASGVATFGKEVEIVKYGAQVRKYLSKIKNPEKYLFVATGHQGEPKATLWKMVKGSFPFKEGDEVVFSCTVIPTPENIKNRERLEEEIQRKKVRIFKDVHVSGHGSREDLRDMLSLVKPEHVIPTHGEIPQLNAARDLALELGWKNDKIHILKNGERLKL